MHDDVTGRVIRCTAACSALGAAMRRRSTGFATATVLGFAGLVSVPTTGHAAPPGHTTRLGGVEPEGAATAGVTGLHYNPAMLATLRGTAVHANIGLGAAYSRIRRNAIATETGAPDGELLEPTNLLNPTMNYFVGASFYFDPWALAVGIYDVGSTYNLASSAPVRFHLAPDPDPQCLRLGKKHCAPNGGQVSHQTDATVALAWNGGRFQLGAAAHFPLVRERFAFDNDTELTPDDSGLIRRCESKEDPSCAERVGFKGWNHWIPRDGVPPGFDAALSLGAAVSLSRGKVTLGVRYRTAPLRRGGEVVLGGVSLVCRPDPTQDTDAAPDLVPACDGAAPTTATLRQRLPQQVALGGSALLGRARLWRIDVSMQWVDYCAGGLAAGRCAESGAQTLRLVGLDRQSFVLPEFSRYRGLADVYSLDVYARYRLRTNASLVFAGHGASPSVRRGADAANLASASRVGGSFGMRIKIPKTQVIVVPGYAVDFFVPRRVGTSDARLDPVAATSFDDSGGDLNSAAADAVLAGRARPTNAGRYFAMTHAVSVALMWGEASAQLDWRLD